jgi:hypothetical protein
VATLTRGLALPATQEDVSLQAIYLADLALAHLRLGDPAAAATAARQALAFYGQTDQPLAATGAQAALAQALLAGGDPAGAATAVADLLRVLDACGGDGPDLPQRDYWLAAQVLQVLGDSRAAAHAAARAGELLAARAQAISDSDLRRAYLTQVAIHAEIEKKMQF